MPRKNPLTASNPGFDRPRLPQKDSRLEPPLNLSQQAEASHQAFTSAMDDDFNTAGAVAALFELVKAINTARDSGATDDQLKPAQDTLRELTGVFGLRLAEKKGSGETDGFIDLLVEVRAEVRKQKLWALSDLIRDRLESPRRDHRRWQGRHKVEMGMSVLEVEKNFLPHIAFCE